MEFNRVCQGDCLDLMKGLDSCSVDSVVTDPPYELGFMGKKWDSSGIAYNKDVWSECLRVLKPGGYLLAFGGSRTFHRLACVPQEPVFLTEKEDTRQHHRAVFVHRYTSGPIRQRQDEAY